jgi:NAD(P)-dependent dehydrogenase (short-subunit alcohol dehydrogenase family)
MLSPDALQGRVVAITGGGSGLGKAMATSLSAAGAIVSICGRREDKLNEAATDIAQKTGNEVFAYSLDVREYEEICAWKDAIITKFGRVDGLINNAAGNFISPTERLSHRAFRIIIDIVLQGSINASLVFGKHWIESATKGNIISITTTYAETGSAFVVPSATAKAGVLALTRSLAVEWAKYGIRTNAISPGPVPTKGAWDRLFPPEVSSRIDLKERNPLKRYGKPEEIGNLAAYLMSDYSGFINGEVVTIDGGEWLQGAGEFNFLDFLSADEWDLIEKEVRRAGKSK